jgi:peptide/nickel transport system permease protein
MSVASAASWLTTDTPATQTQARLGAAYRGLGLLLASLVGRLGCLLVGCFVVVAVLAPLLPLADPNAQNLAARLLAPGGAHWCGTDAFGRDGFARVLLGVRPTLFVALVVVGLSAPVGLLIGAAAALFGGTVERVLMGLTDVFMAFPRLVLALCAAATLGAGLGTAVVAIAATGWPAYARVARAETAAIRNAEFLQAAEALGASRMSILFRHVLPLCVPSMLVRGALDAATVVLVIAGLSFLGLGVPPPTPELGGMVAAGRELIFEAWWVSTFPGIAILLLSLGFNLLGDALRDLVDPRAR